MNRLLLSVGLLMVLGVVPASLRAQPSSQSSSVPSTLYTRLKAQVEQELSVGNVDDDVVTYLQLLFVEPWGLNEQQVRDVLQGNALKACNDAPTGHKLHDRVPCNEMASIVQKTAAREQTIRTLGRTLTVLVTGYELPLSDLPERTLRLSTDLLGILNIWSAGTGSVLTSPDAPTIRTVTVEESAVRPQLEQVAEELKKLSAEEQVAAVWRLRYGARLITGQRLPHFPEPIVPGGDTEGTERQYLDKHWEDLENRLKQLWEAVYAVRIDPPLTSTETAYVVFPEGLMQELLPDNIIVWVRIDGDPRNAYADVGLDWTIPLNPVFPSLREEGTDEPILGGEFPPEPVIEERAGEEPWDGMSLCTNPLARRGYLCRPFETMEATLRCPVEVPADNDTITLVHCTATADKTKSTLQWCSLSGQGGTCYPLDPVACRNAAGRSCGTLEECQKTFGCTPNPPPAQPMWCCLKKAGNMCAVTTSSTECVQRGGSPSQDEEGCVKNGCEAPVPPDIRYTNASADVCREITWKNSEPFDPKTQCKVSLKCAPSCELAPGGTAQTKKKDAQGNIEICTQANPSDIVGTYIIYHELVHAYQSCNMPVGYDFGYKTAEPGASAQEQADINRHNQEVCCRNEGEAYRAQTSAMERDGVFKNADGTPIIVDGVVMNADTAAEAATDWSCKTRGGCFTSHAYTNNFFSQYIVISETHNPKDLPDLCADAIDPKKMDPRVKALKELVEKRDDVCTPVTETEYLNRIGNNVCYIGQCVEQSVELHRITAGRSPAGVQDSVAPAQEPITGTPLGNLLTNPPLSQYRFPPYRPQLLAQTLDAALCQSVGLPPLMPPVLCLVEANRQLQLTRGIGLETIIGLAGQGNEQEVDLRDLVDLARGIGVRTGTELYSEYLRESSRSFAEIIGMAGELLRQLDSIDFPTEMCPISPGLPSPISSVPAQ
jgi:hypothetical protein